jgi:hypothetical protein
MAQVRVQAHTRNGHRIRGYVRNIRGKIHGFVKNRRRKRFLKAVSYMRDYKAKGYDNTPLLHHIPGKDGTRGIYFANSKAVKRGIRYSKEKRIYTDYKVRYHGED